ncbi:hypothetical protein [Leptothrix discophora]|uniref:Portal protein n=1 Tax=Leptothrix discophora TaxID=89 RepID=A0ABT9G0B5_LEPDI|nr:hypothetical protein [Leptothrix discophora]MDP4299920.1 hypothetical protein [Leptothrix discophora]
MFGSTNDAPVALGFTAKQLVDMLNNDRAVDAMKALNYLDGQQESELIKVLNDPARGRQRWKERGLTPRFRNLTKMVVEKSGLLFKDAPPTLEIFDAGLVTTNEAATALLNELLTQIEFIEFGINFDTALRLLKTAMILVQWDAEEAHWCFDILHRGNCEVIIDPRSRKPIGMVHRTADNEFCVWTNEEVIEITQGEHSLGVTNREANPYGIIPMAVFYDTNTPRTGFWVEQDKSLVNLNEMVNLHITDSEYSILWSKMSTLFTNMRPAGDGDSNFEVAEVVNSPLPRIVPTSAQSPGYLAGPGSAVVLDSMGVESPFVRYENPNIDLKPLNEVVDSWIKGYAGDWSVRIEVAGQGRAQSGFQLVVEESDNLDLRKKRQRMFESGFKRLYRVLAAVFNTASGVTAFPPDAQLVAVFDDPVLPVDIQVQETVWAQRIAEGRATTIDYFQVVYGITREEAEERYLEVIEWQKRDAVLRSSIQPIEPAPIDSTTDSSNVADK